MFHNSRRSKMSSANNVRPKAYCQCWGKRASMPSDQAYSSCSCGEDTNVSEWKWEEPEMSGVSWVVLSEDQKQVLFHPYYSSGTAFIRGDEPLLPNHHYYWEVKMLTFTYGTDIMVGVGTNKVNIKEPQFKFASLLGADAESYGLSYTGAVRHAATVAEDSGGFCRGSIIGVRVDLWAGTLEFYINRKPQGVCFYNLRRHEALYPMLCSTAAQSSFRLIYAASWTASLLVDAAKVLAASARASTLQLPPGLRHQLRSQFWLTLTADGAMLQDEDNTKMDVEPSRRSDVLAELLSRQHTNGFYVDSVDRGFRIVVWE